MMKTPENKNKNKLKLPHTPRKNKLNLGNDNVFPTRSHSRYEESPSTDGDGRTSGTQWQRVPRLEFSPFCKEKIEETR